MKLLACFLPCGRLGEPKHEELDVRELSILPGLAGPQKKRGTAEVDRGGHDADACLFLGNTDEDNMNGEPDDRLASGVRSLVSNAANHQEQYRLESRNTMILEDSPSMITVFSYEGTIVHQNRNSRAYFGDGSCYANGRNVLALLFQYEPGKAERMFEELTRPGGMGLWKAVVRVPHSLSPPPFGLTSTDMRPHEDAFRAHLDIRRDETLLVGDGLQTSARVFSPEPDPLPDRLTPVSTSGCELGWETNEAKGRAALVSLQAGERCRSGVKVEPASLRRRGSARHADANAEGPQKPSGSRRQPSKRNSWIGADGPEPRTADEGALRPAFAGSTFADARKPGTGTAIAADGCGGGSGGVAKQPKARVNIAAAPSAAGQRSLSRGFQSRHSRSARSFILPADSPAESGSQHTHVTPLRAHSSGIAGTWLRSGSSELGGSTAQDPLATSTFATLVTSAQSVPAAPAQPRTIPAPTVPPRVAGRACAADVGGSASAAASPAGRPHVQHRTASCLGDEGPQTAVSTASDASIGGGRERTISTSGSAPARRRPVSRALSFALSLGTSPLATAAAAATAATAALGSPTPSPVPSLIGSPGAQPTDGSVASPFLTSRPPTAAAPRSRRQPTSLDLQHGAQPSPRAGGSRLSLVIDAAGAGLGRLAGKGNGAACGTRAGEAEDRRRTAGGSYAHRPWSGAVKPATAPPGTDSTGGAAPMEQPTSNADGRTSAAVTTASTNILAATASWADTAATNLQTTGQISAAVSHPSLTPTGSGAVAVSAAAAAAAKKTFSGQALLFVANASEVPTTEGNIAQAIAAAAGGASQAGEQRVTPQLEVSPLVAPECAISAAGALTAAAFQEPQSRPRPQLRRKLLPLVAATAAASQQRSGAWPPADPLAEGDEEGRDDETSDELLPCKPIEVRGAADDPPPECWHEVWATAARDPVSGQDVLILTQMDVSAKLVAERHLALVMEAEHRLVEQLFPRHILQRITEDWMAGEAAAGSGGGAMVGPGQRWQPVLRDCNALATWHPEVTLLFADIKGFTPMCKELEPRQVMTLLNALYSRYDAMLDKYGVYKVETIGDCYFVAGGLIREDEDGMTAVREGGSKEDPLHADRVFMFAKAMLSAAREVAMPTTGQPVEIRIGIHTGPVVSGVVGTRMPRFCLFGDTVNTASRMESTGVPGAIHVSEATYTRLPRGDQWEPTGGIEVKGKGLMQTYVWRPDAVLAELHRMPAVHGGGSDDATPQPPSIQLLSLAFDVMPDVLDQPPNEPIKLDNVDMQTEACIDSINEFK